MTPKKEAFARALASGASQADAYRQAYDADRMKPGTVRKRASELAADGDVTGMLERLRSEARTAAIMDRRQRLEFWTSIARGQPVDGEVPTMRDRLRASELLGKAEGDFINLHRHEGGDGMPLSVQVVFVEPGG